MTEKIKTLDTVKVNDSGKFGVVTSIQYEHNRYQLRNLSNWQYGIDNLSKVTIDSLITTVESQKEEIEKLKLKISSWHADIYGFNHLSLDCTKRLIAEMESVLQEG